jgi:hypothetical protein
MKTLIPVPRSFPLLLLAAVAAASCGLEDAQRIREDNRPAPGGYHNGETRRETTADAGPLELRVWWVEYRSATGGRSGAAQVITGPRTTVHLMLKNAGTNPAIISPGVSGPGVSPDGEDVPPLPPYYLLDERGRRFSSAGTPGWSCQSDDPLGCDGRAHPGRTTEFSLSFGGIPRDVGSLTLVMDGVKTEEGDKYSFEIPVSLP